MIFPIFNSACVTALRIGASKIPEGVSINGRTFPSAQAKLTCGTGSFNKADSQKTRRRNNKNNNKLYLIIFLLSKAFHCLIDSADNLDDFFASVRLETKTKKRSRFLVVCEVLKSTKFNSESLLSHHKISP